MIVRILIACCLVAVTVAIHSGGLALILSGLWHSPARPHPRFWKVTQFTIRVAWCLNINPRDRDCSLGTGLLVAEMSA